MTPTELVWVMEHGEAWQEPLPPRGVWDAWSTARLPRHTDAVVAAVRDVATRCAPWVRILAGPRLWRRMSDEDDPHEWRTVCRSSAGELWAEVSGLASRSADEPTARVTTMWGLPRVLGTLHHELWHVVESDLHPDDFAVVDKATARGRPQPSQYLDSALERRARLYAAWACARDEGWRPGGRRLDRVLGYVYDGGLARDVARGGVLPQRGPCERAGRLLVTWPLPLLWAAPLVMAALRWLLTG